MTKREDVIVAIPCYTGEVSVETVNGLIGSFHQYAGILWGIGCCNISIARNRLAQQFLRQTSAQKLLFIDTDIQFSEDQVQRLVAHDLPIVAGCYTLRSPKGDMAFCPLRQEALPKERGLYEVRRAGTGFMCIDRSALETIAAEAPDRWYESKGERQYDYFPAGRFGDVYHTDDYGFCELARSVGLTVHVDLDIIVGHKGAIVYRAEFVNGDSGNGCEQSKGSEPSRSGVIREREHCELAPA